MAKRLMLSTKIDWLRNGLTVARRFELLANHCAGNTIDTAAGMSSKLLPSLAICQMCQKDDSPTGKESKTV